MIKRIWKNYSALKNESLIKEDLHISLTGNKNITIITLLRLPSLVIIKLFAIIVIEIVT